MDITTADIVATRTFSMEDQQAFAQLSGDFNPMHVDVQAARRTQAGAPVVHGVHIATWAIESVLRSMPSTISVSALKVQFNNFIHVGVEARVEVESATEALIRIKVSTAETAAVAVLLYPGEASNSSLAPAWREGLGKVSEGLLAPSIEAMGQARGLLPVGSKEAAAAAFPATAEAFGANRLAALFSLTRLVGMTCPGLHSIFGSINIKFNMDLIPDVAFLARSANPEFRLVKMDVAGCGLEGAITAFARSPPIEQPDMARIQAAVLEGEFAGVRALVVGGSRGLGALVSKMLIAGGASVLATYASGKDDAAALKAELLSAKPDAQIDVAEFNVLSEIEELAAPFNQLYYFATPTIYRRRTSLFRQDLFEEFCRFYLYRFEKLIAHMLKTASPLAVFYPSSVFVEEPPPEMVEYAMAKAAGELLCDHLETSAKGLKVIKTRLPKLPTDQTATLIDGQLDDPVSVFLPILRRMAQA